MLNQREYTNVHTLSLHGKPCLFHVTWWAAELDKMCLREPTVKGHLLFYFYLFKVENHSFQLISEYRNKYLLLSDPGIFKPNAAKQLFYYITLMDIVAFQKYHTKKGRTQQQHQNSFVSEDAQCTWRVCCESLKAYTRKRKFSSQLVIFFVLNNPRTTMWTTLFPNAAWWLYLI